MIDRVRALVVAGLTLAALVLSFAGCCPAAIDLDQRFRPLTKIVADGTIPADVYSTHGSIVSTPDLCAYQALDPREQEAIVLHEQLHAEHQFAYPGGPSAYLDRYSRDIEFKVAEELAGWTVELSYCVRHGVPIDNEKVAEFMSTHYVQGPLEANPGRPGIGLDEALKWIASVEAAAQTP